MMNPSMATDRSLREGAVVQRFFASPDEESFADLFRVFTPQSSLSFARGGTRSP